MIPLNLIVLLRRTIDHRRDKLLTNLAGTWMNRVGRGDSFKRGIGRLSGQRTQTNGGNDSVSVIRLQYKILYYTCIYGMYYFMYDITIKVALPVSGLGIIHIFNYISLREDGARRAPFLKYPNSSVVNATLKK